MSRLVSSQSWPGCLFLALCCAGQLLAQAPAPVAPAPAFATPLAPAAENWEEIAEKVQAATVTVRILPPADEKPAGPAALPADPVTKQFVTVCSGIALGGGYVVTHVDTNVDGRIRLTLPGGAQAEARVRVYDQFSGLALLEIANKEFAGLPLASEDETPRVGSPVLSGAAWGVEKPVIAIGHVGGVDRTLTGSTLPPLLQCGLRTVETSAGGPVVDRTGRVIGIIVAADPANDTRGWTYALPVSHLHALKRVKVDGKVIVIPRLRPIVGLQLTQGDAPDTVIIERINKGGPAEKTGLAVGDKVLAVDGLIVRNVYQVSKPIFLRKPGEKVKFLVEQKGVRREIEVTLGGSVELADSDPLRGVKIGSLVNPKIEIARTPDGRFNVVQPEAAVDPSIIAPAPAPRPADAQLYEKAAALYLKLIERQQAELKSRDLQREDAERQIKELQAEVERLKKQLEANGR